MCYTHDGMKKPILRYSFAAHLDAHKLTGQGDSSHIEPIALVDDHYITRIDLQVFGAVTKVFMGSVLITDLHHMKPGRIVNIQL
jgi:hypothetical protein